MSGIKQDVFMPTIEVYDVNQANVTQVDVDEKVFEKKIDESIYYEVVKMQMANARSGTACTKGRSDVRGGGKKTLETKGNRPRTCRNIKFTDLEGRRNRFRSKTS